MQHAQDSAVLNERILADKAPQERRALGARRRAPRIDAMIVPAVDNAVFHGPGQRRAGIIADSVRIGKAAQDVLRLRRVCDARKAGIAVEDDRQILTADGLRGAERVRAAAVDHTGVIGPENGLRIVGTGRDIAEGHVRAGRIRRSGDAVHDGRNHGAVQRQIGGKARVRFAAAGGEYCYTIAARTGEILDVQRPEKPAQTPETPATPDTPDSPTDSEISISEALRRVLQKLGISLPDIRDVNVQRVQVSGRDAYHITFTANGKPYSFYVDTHDGDLF